MAPHSARAVLHTNYAAPPLMRKPSWVARSMPALAGAGVPGATTTRMHGHALAVSRRNFQTAPNTKSPNQAPRLRAHSHVNVPPVSG